MNLDKLNDKQTEAVLYNGGPLLILAGAGSGKTRVLTYKIAYLIEEKKVEPYSILAITFTNKAAKEMKDRVLSLIGDKSRKIQISTFHSFGYKIIRENVNLLGLGNTFTILDESDSITIIKSILKDFNLDYKYYNFKAIKNQISSAKTELLNPKEYQKYINTEWDEVVLRVYKKYQEILFKNNSVDFDDLLMMPIILFRNNEKVLKKYQEQYKYILIDEYQDTNKPQYILSKMISSKYNNICVVGDNDQTIFSWRGANYNNILNFEKDFKEVKVILLEENYRSTKNILKAANNVIKNNKLRKEKNLWTQNNEGSKIKYYRGSDEKDEARYVVNQIKKHHQQDNISYDEIAVLYRTNAQSRILEESFLVENIPYKIIGAYTFYSRKEIKDLVAYLKLIYNEKDNVSLLRCINIPKRGIGNKTIDKLIKKANEVGKSIYEVIDSGKELQFKKIIEEIKEASYNISLTELVDLILDKTELKKFLKQQKNLESDIRLENLEEFKSITKNFEEHYGIISLKDFLMEISLVSNSEETKEEINKVSLMTAHAVKGLEFKLVFIVGVEEGILPHYNSLEQNNELEEERRLFYVAITRSKQYIYFVNAKRRMLFGERRINPESRFITEVGFDCFEIINNELSDEKVNIEDNFYTEDIEYKVGDKVKHQNYGEGVIVGISKDIMDIAFSHTYGIKKFMKNHKSIKKI